VCETSGGRERTAASGAKNARRVVVRGGFAEVVRNRASGEGERTDGEWLGMVGECRICWDEKEESRVSREN
jgi:hypothetical protein